MLTKLGQRGYAVHEESGEYRTEKIDPDTDTDPDPERSHDRQPPTTGGRRREAPPYPDCRYLAVGGGVSLNRSLRERLQTVAARRGVGLLRAEPRSCGDNAAMIAGLVGVGGGVCGDQSLALDAVPRLAIEYN